MKYIKMKITRKQLKRLIINETKRIIVGQNHLTAESQNRAIVKKIMADTLYDNDQNFQKIKERLRIGLNDPNPENGKLSIAQGVLILQGVSFMYPEYEELVKRYNMPSDLDDARLQDLKTKQLLDKKGYDEVYPIALQIAKDLDALAIQGINNQFDRDRKEDLLFTLQRLRRRRGGIKAVRDARKAVRDAMRDNQLGK